MASLSDKARNPFDNLCKGIHSNFTDQQIKRLEEMSQEVREILDDSVKREKDSMGRSAGSGS
jgi:hypothetical protein